MVKVKDLSGIGDNDRHLRQTEYVQCQECNDNFGGTRGDYWEYPPDHIFTCSECGSKNLAIIQDIRVQRIIKI